MSERIIPAERSLMVAADVEPKRFNGLVKKVGHVAGLSSWKIGFEVGLGLSLPVAVSTVKDVDPEAIVIYDHQKGGNDIDKIGMNFARTMKHAEVDAAILFPFTGKKVEERWIKELQDAHIGVIVGSEMTHEGFRHSEGGRIADDRLVDIFEQALELGVQDFVVPGNKPDSVKEYRKTFKRRLGKDGYTLYAPGFIDQGGNVTETGKVAGRNWHAIVGTAIYNAENPRTSVIELVEQMQGGAE